MKSRGIQIPVLKSMELVTKIENGIVNIWIGATSHEQSMEALKKIAEEICFQPKNEIEYCHECKNRTQIGSKRFGVASYVIPHKESNGYESIRTGRIMFYKNTNIDSDSTNALVIIDSSEIKNKYEIVYWYTGKLI